MVAVPGPVVVVSPHMDDGVLSCGELIAQLDDCVVMTVFAGGEGVDWTIRREWDAVNCGIPVGNDVVKLRIAEDDSALSRLSARPHRLDFLDAQYRKIDPEPHAIGATIMAAMKPLGNRAAILPLGLVHGDHKLAAAGAAWAARRTPELAWFAYQDLPYAYEDDPDPDIERALDKISDMAPTAVDLGPEPRSSDKAAALDSYPTQTEALGERREKAMLPERYWTLSPRPRR
jgi:LmbE family N-acetylglucosaminyl deacetylase